MPVFISIHYRFELHVSTPNSPATPVLIGSQTPLSDQNARDIGGLPTLPCPLPGTSYGDSHDWISLAIYLRVAENPIEVDNFSDDECESSVRSDDSKQPGDSIGKLQFHYDQNMRSDYDLDNAIDLDAALTVASNTEVTDNLSDEHYQTECAIDGKSD
jgi:hypothetical protein